MKSESIKKHFTTLEKQRESLFPTLKSLSMTKLWERPEENKWSIGESIYHLFLITKMLRVAAIITIPCTKFYAQMMRNKSFEHSINDIYKEYKEKHGKTMNAPFILNPSNKIYNSMDFTQLNQLLINETLKVSKIVDNIEEDIAGHIIFLDPVANFPNLIQAIQLLAIHEAHHFRIIQKDLEAMIGKTE
ncbi:DinB family protein [Psychrobacillus vulpis]|uniref:DinB family protein n=1 Tax=Psychrobacillus vulpis TaxID=2325572 RepID=A0A544TVC1_9BACI|nr:DinB family protein [Psychrobacillus vulpis]TQR21402.1 DinB family protein [Psychrobacillus vulpis]